MKKYLKIPMVFLIVACSLLSGINLVSFKIAGLAVATQNYFLVAIFGTIGITFS